MSEKKSAAPAAVAAPETPAAEPKKRKSSGAAQRRGRPPLSPEVYVEFGTNQYNITDDAAYYVINKVSGKLEL